MHAGFHGIQSTDCLSGPTITCTCYIIALMYIIIIIIIHQSYNNMYMYMVAELAIKYQVGIKHIRCPNDDVRELACQGLDFAIDSLGYEERVRFGASLRIGNHPVWNPTMTRTKAHRLRRLRPAEVAKDVLAPCTRRWQQHWPGLGIGINNKPFVLYRCYICSINLHKDTCTCVAIAIVYHDTLVHLA